MVPKQSIRSILEEIGFRAVLFRMVPKHFYKCLPYNKNVETEEIYETVIKNNILERLAKRYE